MRLTSIYTYPVKGCHRVEQSAARAEPWGLAGDRRWMIVDAEGVGVTQRETTNLVGLDATVRDGGLVLAAEGRSTLSVPEPVPTDPVGVRTFRSRRATVAALPAGAEADAWLSDLADQPVRLVFLHDPTAQVPGGSAPVGTVTFADAYPMLLANAASLDAVNDWLVEAGDEPVPMTRFRPNLVVSGPPAWAEDEWIGRRIRVGGAVFVGTGLCDRCVVTTIDQETGEKGKQPLRVLGQYRTIDQKLMFGLHMTVEQPGPLAVGDDVTVA